VVSKFGLTFEKVREIHGIVSWTRRVSQLREMCCDVSMWVKVPTLNRRVMVEQLINEKTQKFNVLSFWLKVWCLTHLCVALNIM